MGRIIDRTIVCSFVAITACASRQATAPETAAGGPPAANEARTAAGTPAPSPPASAGAAAGHGAHGASFDTIAGLARGAMLFDGLGELSREVTTGSPEAQAYFDQGLRLNFAFNHDEAARSFAQAAVLDPSCASCFWGVAKTLGPNYNMPMLPDRAKLAWEALQAAQRLADGASPVERALIEALARRYAGPEPKSPPEMATYNKAYAAAMRAVAKRFPADVDVQVLFAEALMDVDPWNLWTKDGKPRPQTREIVATLEKILRKAPNHPGANHYYIHAVEASREPGRALEAAARLPDLVPGGGHLVHMPAHIYQRVGRYGDAAEANRRAAVVDEEYMARTKPVGYYGMYLAHNYMFLSSAAALQGKHDEALRGARTALAKLPVEMLQGMPGSDYYVAWPLFALVRFGRWDALLAERAPDARLATATVMWRWARGMALAAKGRLAEAKGELAAVAKARAETPPERMVFLNKLASLLGIAEHILAGEIARRQNDHAAAIARLRAAVKLEGTLTYNEPPDWYIPARHYLGATLIEAKRYREAERVYREDLVAVPENGWALFGLWQAQEAQRKKGARETWDRFQKAFEAADVKLQASAY